MNTLAPSRSSQEITRSRRIGFLIYPDCEICDVCGPLDVFHFADYWLPRFGRNDEPGYQLVILAASPGPVRTKCGIELVATHSFRDIGDGLDTLVVAGGEDVEQAAKDNPALVEWVRAMAPRVRRVASICTGAFILAAAGLLNHRRVTTHWLFSEALATAYPLIQLDSNLIFARDGNIYTSWPDHRGDRSGPGLGGRRSRLGNYASCRPDDGGFSSAPRRATAIQCLLMAEAKNQPDIRELQRWILGHPGRISAYPR
jgi:putative intracellular protease/amidase